MNGIQNILFPEYQYNSCNQNNIDNSIIARISHCETVPIRKTYAFYLLRPRKSSNWWQYCKKKFRFWKYFIAMCFFFWIFSHDKRINSMESLTLSIFDVSDMINFYEIPKIVYRFCWRTMLRRIVLLSIIYLLKLLHLSLLGNRF